jgi:hypothetical protein
MADNVLLLHFDDNVMDTSPSANALTAIQLGGFVPGVFGTALSDTVAGYVSGAVPASSSLNFGVESVTLALWLKTQQECLGNTVFLGIENKDTGKRPHFWLGCTPLSNAMGGGVGNTLCSVRDSVDNDCVLAPTKSPIHAGITSPLRNQVTRQQL